MVISIMVVFHFHEQGTNVSSLCILTSIKLTCFLDLDHSDCGKLKSQSSFNLDFLGTEGVEPLKIISQSIVLHFLRDLFRIMPHFK